MNRTLKPASFIALDPPGTICQNAALRELLDLTQPRRFMEVGVGAGGVARMLCQAGWQGCGVDSSDAAIQRAAHRLDAHIKTGTFHLHHSEVGIVDAHEQPIDVVVSMMVLEHQEDERAFLNRLRSLVRPGGMLVIGVPARMDHWSIEDDKVGHYRRYERNQLTSVLESAGLRNLVVRSVGVPISNLLFRASTRQVRAYSADAPNDKVEQTAESGVREIPFKTVFPRWCRLLLNDRALWPVCQLQRLFYGSNLGLTLIARGTVD